MKGYLGWLFALFAGALVAACSPPDPLAGLAKGEAGRVVRVIDGDALVLSTGLTVRLAAIEAPVRAWKDRPEAPYSEESARELERLAVGRDVELFYGGLTRDRYDRAIAQVRTTDGKGETLWLNREMVARGAARVRLYPDNETLAEALLTAEREARDTAAGLWALEVYRPLAAEAVADDTSGFVLIEGWLTPAPLGRAEVGEGRRAPACRFSLSTVTVEIETGAASACQTEPGQRVRVRGWLRGGEIRVASSSNLERLGPAQ